MEDAEIQRRQDAPPAQPLYMPQFRAQPFWRNAPELWFSHIEQQFRTANIQADEDKYNALIGALDEQTAIQIADLIRFPPPIDRYGTTKSALINRFSQSEAQKVRQILTGLTLGDKKPSQLLRELQTMAQGRIDQDLLKTIWIERLPPQIRGVILTATGNLDHLGSLADQILEAASPPTAAAITQTDASHLTAAIAALTAKVDQLAATQARMRIQQEQEHHRSRQRSQTPNSNSRNRSPSNRRNANHNPTFCWYHNVFGTQATKCRQPCAYAAARNASPFSGN